MIQVRPITELEGIHECERLQKLIWGFEDLSVVPHHLIITTLKSGGLLLGAYEDERMIGFVYGFPGFFFEEGKIKPKHCSLMAGVLPEQRFRGVGYELKLKQRELVLAQGLDLITWTFDPLQSANAHFNFSKLGVICRRYERDLYGTLRDELNRDLPTDRFHVEWWIQSPRVISRLERKRQLKPPEELPRVNRTEVKDGLLVNIGYDLELEAEGLLVEIPRDINRLKAEDLELAQRWRLETRQIFEHYLGQDYMVSEFFTIEQQGRPRSLYLLERVKLGELLNR